MHVAINGDVNVVDETATFKVIASMGVWVGDIVYSPAVKQFVYENREELRDKVQMTALEMMQIVTDLENLTNLIHS
jgi:hypothetical protein